MWQSYYRQIRRSGEYLPSHLDDSLESTEDTAPAFDLFILLGHRFVGGSRMRSVGDKAVNAEARETLCVMKICV